MPRTVRHPLAETRLVKEVAKTMRNGVPVVALLFPLSVLSACSPGRTAPTVLRWYVQGHDPAVENAVRALSVPGAEYEVEFVDLGSRFYDFVPALQRRLEDDDYPDIVGPVNECLTFQLQNYWIDLSRHASAWYLNDLDARLRDRFTVDGQLVGFPTGIRPHFVYYNKDLLDSTGVAYPPSSSPWDWGEVRDRAVALTRDSRGQSPSSPVFDPMAIASYGFYWQWSTGSRLLWLLGGRPFTTEGGRFRFSKTARANYRWVRDGLWHTFFIPPGRFYADSNYEAFQTGRVGMVWRDSGFAAHFASHVRFAWDIAPQPVSWESEAAVPWNTSMFGVCNRARNPELAVRVLEALSSQPDLYTATGQYPALVSLQPAFLQGVTSAMAGRNAPLFEQSLGRLARVDWEWEFYRLFGDRSYEALRTMNGFKEALEWTPGLSVDSELDRIETVLSGYLAPR
jgi:ABC-type glycerol-3-phosphate transport system substrate-binding protein